MDFGARHPLRRAVLIGVFDHNAQAALANRILRRAQDPNAGLVHLHDRVDALTRTQHQNVHGRRRGHRISIQRDHVEFVTGQRQVPVLDGARVQKMKQHSFAGIHADGLARAQRLVVD